MFIRDCHADIKKSFNDSLYKVFCRIYTVNYLKNRIETERFTRTEYFKIVFSCLLESVQLLKSNYLRGSVLVLRSALENFLKHAIFTVQGNSININEKSYLANKKLYDNLIIDENPNTQEYSTFLQLLNSQMHNLYHNISGISHSLVSGSRDNIQSYFSDLSQINMEHFRSTLDLLDKASDLILDWLLIICQTSLKNWEKEHLSELLSVPFGPKRKISTYKKLTHKDFIEGFNALI